MLKKVLLMGFVFSVVLTASGLAQNKLAQAVTFAIINPHTGATVATVNVPASAGGSAAFSPLPSPSPTPPPPTPSPSPTAWVPDANTFGLYHFDGTLTDSSGKGNDLQTPSGGTNSYSAGVINQAYVVSTVSPAYRFTTNGNWNNISSASQPWTIMLWVNTNNSSEGQALFSFSKIVNGISGSDAVYAIIDPNGVPAWLTVNNDTSQTVLYSSATTPAVIDGSWHHVVYRYNGAGNLDLFVDGALTQSWTISAPIFATDWFGIASSAPFTGMMDDLVVESSALSNAQIATAAGK